MERTLCIIKPDAVKANSVGEILALLDSHDLHPVKLQMARYPRKVWEEFYEEHDGKSFFEGLVEFMASGPVVIVELEGDNAVSDYRRLMGATDPTKAFLGTLRRTFGTQIPANAVHGSDSFQAAQDEIAFWFDDPSY